MWLCVSLLNVVRALTHCSNRLWSWMIKYQHTRLAAAQSCCCALYSELALFRHMGEADSFTWRWCAAKYFTADQPARACYAVKELPLGAKVEIEAYAVTNQTTSKLWDGCNTALLSALQWADIWPLSDRVQVTKLTALSLCNTVPWCVVTFKERKNIILIGFEVSRLTMRLPRRLWEC